MVRRLNIDGDGQGDLAGHGGEQRAVLVYQIDSYRYWAEELGRDDLTPGQFGENFTVDGLPDDEVCIGDRYRIGEAVFEVTQPRVTCYRVGIRMGEPQMAALLVSTSRPGFYLRVLEEGEVEAGHEIVKVSSGPEAMTVAEVDAVLYLPRHTRDRPDAALRIPALSPGWQGFLRGLAGPGRRRGGRHGQRRPDTPRPPPAARLARLPPADGRGILRETAACSPCGWPPPTARSSGRPAGPVPHRRWSGRRLTAGPQLLPVRPPGTPDVPDQREARTPAPPATTCRPRPGRPDDRGRRTAGHVHPGTRRRACRAGVGRRRCDARARHAPRARRRRSTRQVWWVHGARDGAEHPFAAEARGLLAQLPGARSLDLLQLAVGGRPARRTRPLGRSCVRRRDRGARHSHRR